MITTFITGLLVPSVLNFINTNGQLAINADDLKIPRDIDRDRNVEGFGAMSGFMLVILFVIFGGVSILEKKKTAVKVG